VTDVEVPQAPTPGDGDVVVQAGERRSARIESLRAVAALAVLVSHVWLYSHRFGPASYDSFPARLLAGGGFGVQLFFALSGFLIYRPFARRSFGDASAAVRQIDLWTYARNRVVRILPLYLVAVAVLLVFTQAGGSLTQWWRFPLMAQGFFTSTAQTVNGPLWSVVVEAHFYLLLPFVAWALERVSRGRRLMAIVVLLAAAVPSVVLRRIDPDPVFVWGYSLPATFYGFVPGMVLALLQIGWEQRRPARVRGLLASADAWLVASAVTWALCCWDYDWTVPLTALAGFLTVGAVVLPLEPGRLVRLLDLRLLALVGVASYSLYIWHVPIIERLYFRSAFDSFPGLFLAAVPAALAVAAISYAVVERPVLTLRRGWAGKAAGGEERPRPASGRLALANRLTADHRWVAVICGVAFLARCRMVMATRHLVLGNDPADYDRLGRLLADGHGFGASLLSPSGGPTAFRPPLYPLFLGTVYKLTGGSMLAARLLQAALGAVVVGLIWLIAHRLFDRRVALAAAAAAAVYPPLVIASTAVLSESIFIPLMLGALLAALLARDGGGRATHWALAAGALMGLGVLARPNGLAVIPAVLLLSVWGSDRQTALRRAAVLVVGVAAALLPWQVRNATTMDGTVIISDIDGYNTAGVYNDDAAAASYPGRYQFRPPNGVAELAPLFSDASLDEVSLGEELRAEGLDHIRAHPTAPAQAVFWNSFRMLELSGLDQAEVVAGEAGFGRTTAVVGIISFWALALLAAFAAATKALRRVPRSLWLAPALLWLGTTLFLGNARLRAPIEPFIVLAAAPALVPLATAVVDRVRRVTAARAARVASEGRPAPARAG
jgi:peptidoglycan/LPS O-acetylase OafA/YrhL